MDLKKDDLCTKAMENYKVITGDNDPLEKWVETTTQISEEIIPLRQDIETEFRKILGV